MGEIDDTSASIGALEARVMALEKTVERLADRIEKLLAEANMGRGAWFALVKIGAVLGAIAGVCAWAFQQIRTTHPPF